MAASNPKTCSTTEAIAMHDGIASENQIGVHRLILDCQEVLNTIMEGAGSVTADCVIYQGIAIQAYSLDNINYVFCPRDSNVILVKGMQYSYFS